MSFAVTWMDPEIVILNEVSQTEKYKYHMYSCPNFEPVSWFMSGSNYCFLTCIQVSQDPVALHK